jgi:hypothetical protein
MTHTIAELRTMEQTDAKVAIERMMVMSAATKQQTKKPVKVKAAKPAKVASKKPSKKPSKAKAAKKLDPFSGQSAEKRDISFDEFNRKELKVLDRLNGEGEGSCPIFTIKEIAKAAFGNKSKAQSNSWVRNSLRRLAVSGHVKRTERGSYKITAKGRKRIAVSAA